MAVGLPDREWRELVAELWAPFVSDASRGPAVEIGVSKARDGIRLLMDGRILLETEDPWLLLFGLRTVLDQRAIDLGERVVNLHAAGACRDATHLLIVGASGSGKTTLLLGLIERGWTYAFDDAAPLRLDSLSFDAHPRPIGVRNISGSWDRFSKRWATPDWLPVPSLGFLVPTAVLGAGLSGPFSPNWVVFPRFVEGAQASITVLTRAEGVSRLGAHLDPIRATGLTALSEMSADVHNLEVVFGTADQAIDRLLPLLLARSD